ncbi:MAG: hypothetical protein F6J86_04995 [Symploca sp. SIO1B1]|nr:hypothetical protein [Symploca sp. SIO1C2]NER93186.1 hypothetical protein [Symploca sp. SIO1B1]
MNIKKSLSVLLALLGILVFVGACGSNSDTAEQGTEETTEVAEAESTQEEAVVEFDEEKTAKLTATARFLAGMEVSDNEAIAQMTESGAWQSHASYLNGAWSQLEAQQLSKARAWSEGELQAINASSPPIFYPFSGPDFLYGFTMFPKGSEYVMLALEPVGEVPDLEELSESQRNAKLQGVVGALSEILKFSFFRTNDMQVDLAQQGALPIILVFMARTNNQIMDIQPISMDENANIQPQGEGAASDNSISGVKITFLPEGESDPRTLHYFSTDISNEGLAKTPQLKAFVEQLGTPTTYLKAASYLMYRDSFSQIRDLILTQSDNLLQDDSGMPIKYVDEEQWDITYYGNYTSPIGLFAERYQPDLRKIYQGDNTIKPLNFGIGYKFGVNESNLMLSTKKDKPE